MGLMWTLLSILIDCLFLVLVFLLLISSLLAVIYLVPVICLFTFVEKVLRAVPKTLIQPQRHTT